MLTVVLSTRRAEIVADVLVLPAASTATARRSYRPSAMVVVVKRQVHGAAAIEQMSVQLFSPVGERWIMTPATPESASSGVVASVTVPLSVAPGSVIVTVGTTLSTSTATTSLAVVLPAPSVARARRSNASLASVVVFSEQL